MKHFLFRVHLFILLLITLNLLASNSGEGNFFTGSFAASALCASAPLAGSTQSSSTQLCAGDSVLLILIGNSIDPGISFQWQLSTDSMSWTTIIGATDSTYKARIFNPTYYRCKLSCNGFISYSNALLIGLNAANNCYCVSAAMDSSITDIGIVSIAALTHGTASPVLNNPTAVNSYSNFTNLPATNLAQLGTYTLKVSQIISNFWDFHKSFATAFIDFNQNGFFENSETFQLGSTSAVVPITSDILTTIFIPLTVSLGNTRMRIILAEDSAVTSACSAYSRGETEDYTVNIIPVQVCPAPLSGGNATVSVSSVCPGAGLTLSVTGNSSNSATLLQWQYSPDSINWTTLVGSNYVVLSRTQSQNTYYRFSVTCSGNVVYSNSVYVAMKAPTLCYCACYATNSSDGDIGNVNFAGLNNGIATPVLNNSTSTHTYTNFTSLTPPVVQAGATYPISISQINSSQSHNSQVSVFIDFNQDGTLSFSGEYFSLGSTSAGVGGNTLSQFITIPATASIGTTLMRVVLAWPNSGGAPCGTYSYGETEDYLINIVPLQACATAPIAGNAYCVDTTVCQFEFISLSLQNNSLLPSQKYQWQSSPDNINWSDMIGDTLPGISSFQVTSSIYLRCLVTCNGFLGVYSTPVHVNQNLPTKCYCTSSAISFYNCDIGNVTFIGMNNGIGTPALGNSSSYNKYTDFTWLPQQTILPGASYPISVSAISKLLYYDCVIAVYIDFNQDGYYDTSTEKFSLGVTTNTPGGNTLNGIVVVPLNALQGYTQMRIVLKEGANSVANPCGTYTDGETEDYAINIGWPSGASSLSDISKIELYPNPVHTAFTLKLSGTEFLNADFLLFNSYGEIVYKTKIKASETKIETGIFPKGIYFLKLTTKTMNEVRKVVVE